ncbi:hypothetical protein [Neorhizobium petrolearium]|uniref:hypothetical protein n=1 Tax=Neorhizobium petrolearium TaxID=515361 RepID=UPI003F174B3E
MAEEMTIEQQRAIAVARARLRLQQQGGRADDALSIGRTGVGGLIEGIPIVGPYLRSGTEKAAAATVAAFSDRTYDDVLKQIDAANKAEKEANPWVDKGAQVAGAVGGTIPMIMAAPTLMGAGGGGLLANTAASTGSGAVIGGLDAGVRGDWDIDEIKRGTELGAGMGLIGPVAGKAVGSGVRKVLDALASRGAAKTAGTTRPAIRELAETVSDDGLTPFLLREKLDRLGPEGMILDAGPGLTGTAGGLAASPGRAQEIVRNAIVARNAAGNGRVERIVNETLGPNVVPSEIRAGIEANQNAVGPWYREVFEGVPPYDSTPIADALDDTIRSSRGGRQAASRDVRNMLNTYGTDQPSPNPRVLFETRQAIDGRMKAEVDPRATAAYTEARGFIDDALRQAVPGIKEPDAVFAELARQDEALTRGQTVLSHGREAPRPSELAREVQEGALPQGMQIGPSAVPLRLSQGARAEVDRILGSNRNDIVALNRIILSEGDWNRVRLATLFGQEKADRLFRVLENERTFAETYDTVIRNSETARRQAKIRELSGETSPDLLQVGYASGGLPGLARAGAVTAGNKAINAVAQANREATNEELARLITSNRQEVIEALAKLERGKRYSPAVEAVARALLLGGGTAGARGWVNPAN